MYNRPPVMLIILSTILGFGVEFPQLYIKDFYPNCQFAGDVISIIYYRIWRDQLQNCLDSALAKLENWLQAPKHTKLNHMCYKQYNIFMLI